MHALSLTLPCPCYRPPAASPTLQLPCPFGIALPPDCHILQLSSPRYSPAARLPNSATDLSLAQSCRQTARYCNWPVPRTDLSLALTCPWHSPATRLPCPIPMTCPCHSPDARLPCPLPLTCSHWPVTGKVQLADCPVSCHWPVPRTDLFLAKSSYQTALSPATDLSLALTCSWQSPATRLPCPLLLTCPSHWPVPGKVQLPDCPSHWPVPGSHATRAVLLARVLLFVKWPAIYWFHF